MARQIQEVMTKQVQCVGKDTPLKDVARMMRDQEIGDVLVTNDDGTLCGIVTDRDIVVRAVAEGKNLQSTKADEVCTHTLINVEPTATVDETVRLMRERAIRRVPVVQNGKPIGIVSIGDLAIENDPRSALAQISAAAPNN